VSKRKQQQLERKTRIAWVEAVSQHLVNHTRKMNELEYRLAKLEKRNELEQLERES